MIDPNIALSVRNPQFKSATESYGQALTLKNLMNQGKQQDMQMQLAQKELDTYDSRAAMEGQKAQQDIDLGKLNITAAQIDNGIQMSQFVGGMLRSISDPIQYGMARQRLAAQFGESVLQELPEQYDPALVQSRAEEADYLAGRLEEMKGTFGNTPIWGKDQSGNWVVLQSSTAGGQLVPAAIPDGVTLERPQFDPVLQGQIQGAKTGAAQDAEIDALPERGDIEAENAKKLKVAQMQAEYEAKASNSQDGISRIISEARSVLEGPVKPTSSGVGKIVDAAGALVGVAPEGSAEADQLSAIGGALVSKMPRMEGPQSNIDVENYKVMAGRVGDSSLPIERRLAALQVVESLWGKYGKQQAPSTTKPANKPPAQSPGKPMMITTDEEYEALPSGSLFIDPDDGDTYRKP